MTAPPTRNPWPERLRRTAARTLGQDLGASDWAPDAIGRFADERGHRRTVDPYLLAWRARDPALAPESVRTDVAEAALWAGLSLRSIGVRALLADRIARLGATPEDPAASLFPQPDDVVIEVWTETELASLHALWWHAQRDHNETLRRLVREVAAWHIERLQPDNATNHPWALHVFLLLDREEQLPGASHYAQTLLHNCVVSLGRPDRLSAHILADSADAIEGMTS